MVWSPPRLETNRLLLRGLHETDAEAIYFYASNPNVARYTLWEPHTVLSDSVRFIRDIAHANYAQRVPEPFGICLKEAPDRVIGTVGCIWASKANRAMELGYALSESYWGKGLAAEAAHAVVAYAFSHYPIERLLARCMAENRGSARVMEKLGMQHEGTLRSDLFRKGRFWDIHLYAMLRSDWTSGSPLPS